MGDGQLRRGHLSWQWGVQLCVFWYLEARAARSAAASETSMDMCQFFSLKLLTKRATFWGSSLQFYTWISILLRQPIFRPISSGVAGGVVLFLHHHGGGEERKIYAVACDHQAGTGHRV